MIQIWNKTIKILEERLPEHNFSTWIRPINFLRCENETLHLEVNNRFIANWITDNYIDDIKKIIKDLNGTLINIDISINKSNLETIKVKETSQNSVNKKDVKPEIREKTNNLANLNNKYTFDEFISGSSNQFATAAAMAVATNPATTYNPLFIYGGVGLGKTHLINAIGNRILEKQPHTRVCYYTSEKFINEMINCIRYAKMEEFRNKFRSMDVLLIDDIQFLEKKERTQEEFFHTFNALYDSQKQIIITSDKFPKEMPGLEERLRSRFEWGLIADIQPPDVETRLAILNLKAERNSIKLPEEVAQFLANSVSNNVRELEGYLIRIGAFASLTSTPISLDMAKDVLKDILVDSGKILSIEKIQKIVAGYYNIKVSDLKSPKRIKTLVLPRQIAMYLSRQLTGYSYPEIGEKFGGKDHSTIIHAIKKIDKLQESDFDIKTAIMKLEKILTQ